MPRNLSPEFSHNLLDFCATNDRTLGLIGLDPTEYAPLLAPLVDVLLPEDRAATLAPEDLRRRQLAAMTAWILAAAKTQAIVLAFEDLHWADPTSLDLMRALAERGAQAPLLIIATARPEVPPPVERQVAP
jgi:predicted ATPase